MTEAAALFVWSKTPYSGCTIGRSKYKNEGHYLHIYGKLLRRLCYCKIGYSIKWNTAVHICVRVFQIEMQFLFFYRIFFFF